LEEAYEAPRTPTEQVLAEIWAQVLGLERVGIHDNFFALGGDSLLAMRIVAKANQNGLAMRPKQLFQFPTIAELGNVLTSATNLSLEQSDASGSVPLTPAQQWFFEQDQGSPHQFIQEILFQAKKELDGRIIDQAVRHVVAHHDALRLRFIHDVDGWRQCYADAEENQVFVDYAEVDPRATLTLEAIAEDLRRSLNITDGPLLRVALIQVPGGLPSRLLIVIHHLAVDAMSWPVLIEDFELCYRQAEVGMPMVLPPKTTPFKRWADRMTEYATSEGLAEESQYWLARPYAAAGRLPETYAARDSIWAPVTIGERLDGTLTTELLDLQKTRGHPIYHLLVSALVKTLAEWLATDSVLLDLEGHGREDIFEDVDLSRTVGWFTSIFPMVFDFVRDTSPEDVLTSIGRQMHAVPNRGIGYGILRYLAPHSPATTRLQEIPPSQISFNYLGQIDRAVPMDSLLELLPESAGPVMNYPETWPYHLGISAQISHGALTTKWTFNPNLLESEVINRQLNRFIENLRWVVRVGAAQTEGFDSRSEFGRARLERRPLEQLISSGRYGTIDAAAVVPLPEELSELGTRAVNQILRAYEDSPPLATRLYSSSIGRIVVFTIPRFAHQLYDDREYLVKAISVAAQLARPMGVRVLALADLIASATDYGRDVSDLLQPPSVPCVTTGHATTAASVVMMVELLSETAGRQMRQEHLGVLGMGSVGIASLELALARLPHPRALSLCDVPAKRSFLNDAAKRLVRDYRFRGAIHIHEAGREAPADFYDSTLIIGATNVPDVLDVARLHPETIIVDDSGPHCFSATAAVKRFEETQDILFSRAGFLRATKPIGEVRHLPQQLPDLVDEASYLERDDVFAVESCVLSALLSARFPEAPPTVGTVNVTISNQHYEELRRLGFGPGRIQCSGYVLPRELIEGFQRRFRAKD
ncbi:MAG: condensation domain-containing protein, partial [Candidatus Dormibacteraceae bacterium]